MRSRHIGFIPCVNITPWEILFLNLHNGLCMETYQIPRTFWKFPLKRKSLGFKKYSHLPKASSFTLNVELKPTNFNRSKVRFHKFNDYGVNKSFSYCWHFKPNNSTYFYINAQFQNKTFLPEKNIKHLIVNCSNKYYLKSLARKLENEVNPR